jgi:allantoate deiminase
MNGHTLIDRIDALAQISERPDCLVRRFLTPEHRAANALVGEWMRGAGMDVRVDAIGNVIGRYAGTDPTAPALLIGSHLDTIVDAGRFDGMLGVVSAIACIEDLARRGVRRPFPIEIVGFADEEGARFGATLLGSRALTGTFDRRVLSITDDAGVSMAAALRQFGLDPDAIGEAARRPGDYGYYLELHIEQGPVLEAQALAVGCVTAINGALRYSVTITGDAGHAGTVPMGSRRDALAAAAACVLAVEERCSAEPDLVGTVGMIEAKPGVVNVVPGAARFSLDLRAPEDARRDRAAADLLARFEAIAAARKVTFSAVKTHEGAAVACAEKLMAAIDSAIVAEGITPLRLPSGAGHDGMAVVAIAPIGMIFVRCKGGISHNPAESVTAADAETGARVLLRVIEQLEP